MDKQKKILVAEDERPLAKALELKLSHSGYEVTVATNGQEALDKLQNGGFDLVLLDLMMPVLDGFSVLEKLKSQNISVPVIVTSNLGQKEDIDKAKKLGAKEYFIKSNTQLSEIVEYIKTALS